MQPRKEQPFAPPKFLGKCVYFFGYPVFRSKIKNTTRTYVLLQQGDTFLFTKNWLGFQKKWRLPGGGVHGGEPIIDAAIREVYEELGVRLTAAQLRPLTKKPLLSTSFDYHYHLFSAELPKNSSVRPDRREILDAQFFNAAELQKFTICEEAVQALRLANHA